MGVATATIVALLWFWRRRRQQKYGEVDGLDWFVADVNFGGGTHDKGDGTQAVPTKIYDGRGDVGRFGLHSSGFELIAAPALQAAAHARDLYDANEAVAALFPIAEAIVLHHCAGATAAYAFDHILRNPARLETEEAQHSSAAARAVPPAPPKTHTERLSSEPARRRAEGTPLLSRHLSLALNPRPLRASSHDHEQATHELLAVLARGTPSARAFHDRKIRTRFLQGTLPCAHGDYTARSGCSRAEQLLSPYVDAALLKSALSKRVAIVNVWYPCEPVESDPLVMCTWKSCDPRDVQTSRITFSNRIGETYRVSPQPRQNWVYFSDMQPNEAILLKTFDSLEDGTARWSLHSAFGLPRDASKAAPQPRVSLEIRVLVLWAPEAKNENFLSRPFVPPHMARVLRSHTTGVLEVAEKIEVLPASDEW